MGKTDSNIKIVLFDGLCNLCSGFVKFILNHEKNSDLKFASLQSEYGNQIIKNYKISHKGIESIVLIESNRAYEKSDAVLRISRNLKFPFSLVKFFRFIPKAIRDNIYDLVASNRYRIFGKKETCWIPQQKWLDRFIET